MAKRETIDQRIERILHTRLAHILADISWRLDQLRQVQASPDPAGRQVFAEELNLQGHAMLTGYAVTANSPSAGSIAWTDLHMVYNGTDTAIVDANTAMKYAWWSPTTTPTALQVSNTKPTLSDGETLVFVNNNGTPVVALSSTNQSLPSTLANGAVDSSAILANAVTSTALADGAVGAAAIAANAVTGAKLADGAVSRSGQLAANVVGASQLADNAVDSGALAAGAVSAAKLNILQHVLY